MQPKPWTAKPVTLENFIHPPREYGLLPSWFLNGELDVEEMRFQLGEFHAKGIAGIILHGRSGLETPPLDQVYPEQIKFAVEEAGRLGMKTWVYDKMNWPELIQVEGSRFKHYPHMDVIGVDHCYPVIGTRDRPGEHVALKAGSSAAHQLGSPRLLCESSGGTFMDTTLQRMKWIADWEYVLGVNLLNPHGFHYSLEGSRKRDEPFSPFYQSPWWRYYGGFSVYISRLSHMLSGGRHVAKVAVLWPVNARFGSNTLQGSTPLAARQEIDFGVLTDTLLRIHHDFDYLPEDVFANAELRDGRICVHGEAYQLLVLPPMTHINLSTVEKIEAFVRQGGKVLATVFLPDLALVDGQQGLVDVSERIIALFGVDPGGSQRNYRQELSAEVVPMAHPGGGQTAFFRSYALRRGLPLRIQKELGMAGVPEHPDFVTETSYDVTQYFYAPAGKERQEITLVVEASRRSVSQVIQEAINAMIAPDVEIDNPEVFCLHRVKDERELYFLVNTTYLPQRAEVSLWRESQPLIWNPSTGAETPAAPLEVVDGKTCFTVNLPPAGSLFVLAEPVSTGPVLDTNLTIDRLAAGMVSGYGRSANGFIVVRQDGQEIRLEETAKRPPQPVFLEGDWDFLAEGDNALVIGKWLAAQETHPGDLPRYTLPQAEGNGWVEMGPGAWSHQLPVEPDSPYPIPVWFQARFQAAYLPEKLDILIDGFAGSEWKLYVNGQPVNTQPVRSAVDAHMKAVNIRPHVQLGENIIAVRLVLTGPTGGLIDLLKLTGNFSLEQTIAGYQLAAPRTTSRLAPWNREGYPFYSGTAVYTKRFSLPPGCEPGSGLRLFLEPRVQDDVVEVSINGKPAGIRLWAPYPLEITGLVSAGENLVEIRTSNTLINLLEGVERQSGLCGAPRLVMYRQFEFTIPHQTDLNLPTWSPA